MARQTNAQYWAQRMKNMEDALLDQSYEHVENLEKQFATAAHEIERQMALWYQRLADNNDISLAEAQKLLKADELKEFHWAVEEYIAHGQENALDGSWIKQLENASAKVHITRLEALQMQLRQQAELLAALTEKATQSAAEAIYEGCYYHTAYEFQKGLGVGWSVSELNDNIISKVLSKPWTTDMQTFRDRCWTNKTSLVDSVNKHLTQMIIRGDSPDKAIAAIAKDFEVSKSKAGRLVMTESAYFSSAAQKDCYKELDVEQYQIVASLDHETCALCGAMDGKVFKMSDYQPGLTANPFHPWCRCCTAPYFEDIDGLGERYARDAVTGERYKVPRNMSYEQWKEKQDELHGAGTVDLQRKISYNETTDKAQYEKYVSDLGSNAPSSFKEFQTIKYGADWDAFKAYAKSIKGGELSALADFNLYKDMSSSIDKSLVGAISKNGIVITGKSNHFIARTIGSVEQRRNGVLPQESLKVITDPVQIEPVIVGKDGKKSQRFIGESAAVTINPDTGVLIQVNPVHSKGGKKKK